MDAVGRQQKSIAGGERLLDHVHVGRASGCRRRWSARGASGDVPAGTRRRADRWPSPWPSTSRRRSAGATGRRPAGTGGCRRRGRPTAGRRRPEPRQSSCPSRVSDGVARLFEHLHVRQINRGPNQISGFGQGRIEAERPADVDCAASRNDVRARRRSADARAAISPALWPPMPSAITQSRRSSSIAKRSWLVGLTAPFSLTPHACSTPPDLSATYVAVRSAAFRPDRWTSGLG